MNTIKKRYSTFQFISSVYFYLLVGMLKGSGPIPYSDAISNQNQLTERMRERILAGLKLKREELLQVLLDATEIVKPAKTNADLSWCQWLRWFYCYYFLNQEVYVDTRQSLSYRTEILDFINTIRIHFKWMGTADNLILDLEYSESGDTWSIRIGTPKVTVTIQDKTYPFLSNALLEMPEIQNQRARYISLITEDKVVYLYKDMISAQIRISYPVGSMPESELLKPASERLDDCYHCLNLRFQPGEELLLVQLSDIYKTI